MWGSGEVLHLGGGGEHVPRARPTGEPVAVRVPGSAEEGQALGAELGRGFPERGAPQIDEERFAPMYCADNGRPNRAVQTVLGVHLLKEMFNLTDDEALEQLEFNLLWHHALRLDMEETHLPQKTLHNRDATSTRSLITSVINKNLAL